MQSSRGILRGSKSRAYDLSWKATHTALRQALNSGGYTAWEVFLHLEQTLACKSATKDQS